MLRTRRQRAQRASSCSKRPFLWEAPSVKVTSLTQSINFEHQSPPMREPGSIFETHSSPCCLEHVILPEAVQCTALPSSLQCAKMHSALRCAVSKTVKPHPANNVSNPPSPALRATCANWISSDSLQQSGKSPRGIPVDEMIVLCTCADSGYCDNVLLGSVYFSAGCGILSRAG